MCVGESGRREGRQGTWDDCWTKRKLAGAYLEEAIAICGRRT